jgi:hypothetical protein
MELTKEYHGKQSAMSNSTSITTATLRSIGDALGIMNDCDEPLSPAGEGIGDAIPVSSNDGMFLPSPITTAIIPLDPNPPLDCEPDIEVDFQFARRELIAALATGEVLLQRAAVVARESETARVFEVAAGLLNTQVTAARALLSLHDQYRKTISARPEDDGSTQPDSTIINNNTFIGSPADLQAAIRAKNNNT